MWHELPEFLLQPPEKEAKIIDTCCYCEVPIREDEGFCTVFGITFCTEECVLEHVKENYITWESGI